MDTEDKPSAVEATQTPDAEPKQRKAWHAPKFMVSDMSATANTNNSSSDHLANPLS